MMKLKNALFYSVFAGAVVVFPIGSQAQDVIRVGTLRCDVSAGLGLVVTSSRDMNCMFQPMRGRSEAYRGTIRRFGLDIGATSRGILVWEVMAATRRPVRGALEGEYAGATAEATVGVGLGVNALVGGSGQAYSLQPISVEGQLGLSLAAGVAQMNLQSRRR
ncbi:MAG: DUF992 domain-containing protein [Beijerinckiaceae bacterium]|nr:DUF992 domain-containing protein [Beijerinckiaceae bacterium]MCZ8300380.1 DUF992 domain-containing protein [Beijerinckiaceae bacterium]